jgi:hypothetical protein
MERRGYVGLTFTTLELAELVQAIEWHDASLMLLEETLEEDPTFSDALETIARRREVVQQVRNKIRQIVVNGSYPRRYRAN